MTYLVDYRLQGHESPSSPVPYQHWTASYAEVGKVTFKSNDDEALDDEFLLKSNGNEALKDVFQ